MLKFSEELQINKLILSKTFLLIIFYKLLEFTI